MTEVREAMENYTKHPDPTESAARRERFRQAEEAGEVEETALLMISDPVLAPSLQDRPEVPCNPEESFSPRIPALLRLGPIMENDESMTTPQSNTTKIVVKRKRGRPPGRKNLSKILLASWVLAYDIESYPKPNPRPSRRKATPPLALRRTPVIRQSQTIVELAPRRNDLNR